jgi:hypothetical protein
MTVQREQAAHARLPLLRPVLAANYRRAVVRGEESLRLDSLRRRATSAERRQVSLPPPATFRRLTRGRHA